MRTNLRLWEKQSDAYDRRFARVLGGDSAMAWGFWRLPESTHRWLGRVRSRDVLELGCGAARWSLALRRRGARAVGLDLSRSQLAKARTLARRTGARLPLVRADAERLPFAARSFDVVFSDWGAMTFCDPRATVPEVARVLRPGGRFVFASSSPFRVLAQDRRTGKMASRLRYPYFGLDRIDYPEETNFTLPYGAWFRLFSDSGLAVESLVEPVAPPDRPSRYLTKSEERWARRWPLESIWSLRRP